jgi:uncharacterized membrane protein YhaH (DUF805 family)
MDETEDLASTGTDRSWESLLDRVALGCSAIVLVILVASSITGVSLGDQGFDGEQARAIKVNVATQTATATSGVLVLLAAIAVAARRHFFDDTERPSDVSTAVAAALLALAAAVGILFGRYSMGDPSWQERVQGAINYGPAIALAGLALWLAPPKFVGRRGDDSEEPGDAPTSRADAPG